MLLSTLAGRRESYGLQLACAEVLGEDAYYTVDVDVEGLPQFEGCRCFSDSWRF